jgi:hypothetical protein
LLRELGRIRSGGSVELKQMKHLIFIIKYKMIAGRRLAENREVGEPFFFLFFKLNPGQLSLPGELHVSKKKLLAVLEIFCLK